MTHVESPGFDPEIETLNRRNIMKHWIIFIIIFCSAGIAAKDTVPCPASDLAQQAGKLDQARIESVLTLADAFEKLAAGQSAECISKMLTEFVGFYESALLKYDQSVPVPYDAPDTDAAAQKLKADLAKVGWEIKYSEGMAYVGQSGGWIVKRFKNILPPEWIEYYAISDPETEKGFADDAALMITWEELAGRIVSWDRFLVKHPDFPLKRGISETVKLYLNIYLSGIDNTPVTVNYDDPKLHPELKQSYEAFLKNNKDSKYYPLIDGYWRVLSENDFQVNDKTRSYVAKAMADLK